MSVKRRLWVFMAVPLIVIAGVWMIASAIRLWDWHATRRAAAESSAEARATSKKLRKIHRKSRVARMTRAGTGNGAGGSPGAATSPRSVELAMAPTGGSRGANAGAGGGDSSSSEDDPEGEFGSSDSSDEEERGGEVATVNPVLSPGSSSTSSRVQRSMKHMKEHNPEVAAAYAEFFARKRNPWAASMWRRAIRGTLITLFISYMAVSRVSGGVVALYWEKVAALTGCCVCDMLGRSCLRQFCVATWVGGGCCLQTCEWIVMTRYQPPACGAVSLRTNISVSSRSRTHP